MNPIVLVLVLETKRRRIEDEVENDEEDEGAGSWKASFRFFACSGTMNQIGPPLPALSPQGGERVAEGRERGGSWESWEEIGQIS